jgi:prenyltransferase beta subunit
LTSGRWIGKVHDKVSEQVHQTVCGAANEFPMSIRLEMLQVARLAPKLLGESAALVGRFLRQQQNDDGGFKDRSGKSDLYYTVFGLEGLLALQTASNSPPGLSEVQVGSLCEKTVGYLKGFAEGKGLDFVHLCCLARAWASIGTLQSGSRGIPGGASSLEILRQLEPFRSRDGGFAAMPKNETGTAYACFLGLAALQDLQAPLPDATGLEQCLRQLRTRDGAWTNESTAGAPQTTGQLTVGSTNATAAVVTVLRQFHLPVNASVGAWLLARAHPQGGFLAMPNAPMPDLLSTATALHALAGLQVSFEPVREACLDFVDSLWTNEGGFYGHWHDDHLDCEYTYYGLLALGHLSL